MEITIDLPEQTVRKVKAFGVLCGGLGMDLESLIVSLVDESVSTAIIQHVGGRVDAVEDQAEDRGEVYVNHAKQKVAQRARPASTAHRDLSGITDGLGDDDDSEAEDVDASSDEGAFIPKKGGLTERDLEDDMSLTDPLHEAKVDAPHISRAPGKAQPDAESLFAELSGLPPPPVVDPRAAQRKKQLKSKAKVSYASGADA